MDNRENKSGVLLAAVGMRFFYPAQDSKGHSARFSFRAVPGWAREIEMLTRPGNRFGFQTQSDFLRWALREALNIAVKLAADPDLTTLDQQTNAMIDILNEKRFLLTQEQIFGETEDLIRQFNLRQEHEEIQDTLTRLKQQIDGIAESRSRMRWEREFETRFGHLVAAKQDRRRKLAEVRKLNAKIRR